jgi:hypothetical protein
MGRLSTKGTVLGTVPRFDIDNTAQINGVATTGSTHPICCLTQQQNVILAFNLCELEGGGAIELDTCNHLIGEGLEPLAEGCIG